AALKKQRVKDTRADVSAGLEKAAGVVDVERGVGGGEVYAEGKGAGRGKNESSYTRVTDTIRSFYTYFLQSVQVVYFC
ncbi:hypothetical protein Tco_0512672, partial [Tanacetum coccineum]